MFRVYGEYMIWKYMGKKSYTLVIQGSKWWSWSVFSSPGDFFGFSTDVIENFQLVKKYIAERCNSGHLGSIILKDLGSLKKTGTCVFSESLGYKKVASEEWGGTEPKKTTCEIPFLLVAYYRPSEWLSITSEYTCVKWFPIYPKQPESSSLLVWIFQSGGTKLKLETWNERPIEKILKPPKAMENKTQLGIPAKFSCKTRVFVDHFRRIPSH